MKNIKKIALSLLVVGLAVGFSAFTSKNKMVDVKYRYDSSQLPGARWIAIPGAIKLGEEQGEEVPTYDCALSDDICTATFPGTVDPNVDNTEYPALPGYIEPTSSDEGEYFELN